MKFTIISKKFGKYTVQAYNIAIKTERPENLIYSKPQVHGLSLIRTLAEIVRKKGHWLRPQEEGKSLSLLFIAKLLTLLQGNRC